MKIKMCGLRLLITAVICLLLQACAERSESLSAHVERNWSEALASIEVSSLVLDPKFYYGDMAVCEASEQLLGECFAGAIFHMDDDHRYLISGTKAVRENGQWVVYVPESAKTLPQSTVLNYINYAIEALVAEKARRIAIANTWNWEGITR